MNEDDEMNSIIKEIAMKGKDEFITILIFCRAEIDYIDIKKYSLK